MTSCCRNPLDRVFDDRMVRRDLRRFRKKGPDRQTRELLSAVEARNVPAGASLLDIGGGVGAIHHTLLDRGFSRATHVDFSRPYLGAAREEAERRGHGARVEFRYGDFTDLASTIEPADLVTLDRVVCCDPDYTSLLGAAAGRARRMLAFSYPRRRWGFRAFAWVANLVQRVMRRSFRIFVHPPEAMRAVLTRAGLQPAWRGGGWIWAVEVFERVEG